MNSSGYRPERPSDRESPFQWPPRPMGLLRFMFGFPGYLWPWPVFFMGLSFASWRFFASDMTEMRSFSAGWIMPLFACNCALLIVFASAWHVRFYVRKAQGTEYKYNSRWLSVDNPAFLFGDQLWDNVFWNIFSAVPIWTAYAACTFWLQANGVVPTVDWQTHPAYCVLIALLTPIWVSIHFYVTHRLIHWPPLYKSVHYLHHKNVNIGPWSGLAMHPVEHLVFFSAVLLLWVLPSHPLHTVYLLVTLGLSPSMGHLGFDKLVLKSKRKPFSVGDYMHYLHHKYFKVNFGAGSVPPIDKWFGTFHDGSDEATEAFKRRERERALRVRGAGK